MSAGNYASLPWGWITSPLKHVVTINPDVLPESTNADEVLQYVDIAALEGGSGSLAPIEIKFSEAPSRARRVLKSGDTIVSTVRTYLKAIATFPSVEGNLIASTGFAVLRPNGKLHSRFTYWATLAEPFIENVVANSTGVSYPAIAPTTLGNLPIAVPPPSEQERIANFLDDKTARIDALIAEKELLSVRLQEFRSAAISAVVDGYDTNNTETCGVTRLRFVADLNPSIRKNLLQDLEEHVSFLPMEAIGEDGSLNLERTRSVGDVRNGYSFFEDGDVTFAKVTPCFENGKGALMQGLLNRAGFGTTEVTVLRPKAGTDAGYLRYVVQSERFRRQGVGAMTGAGGLKRVPDEFTRDFKVRWPSETEQRRLAAHLTQKLAQIDAIRQHVKKQVDRLREYRSSLISAAVTGQLVV